MSRIHLIILCLTSLAVPMSLSAQSDYSFKEWMSDTEKVKQDALKLSSEKIWSKLESASELQRYNVAQEGWHEGIMMTPLGAEIMGYQGALESRKNEREPMGAYYYALASFRSWAGFTSSAANKNTKVADDMIIEVIQCMRFAADANIPDAMFSLAIIYKNGYGVRKSNLVASDWFTKAAKQELEDGDRESALTNVEEALTLVPDHPVALKLRKQLLDPQAPLE